MDEPVEDDAKPPQSRWKLWLVLSSSASGVLLWLGISAWRDLDPIVAPMPAAFFVRLTAEQRKKLSPKVAEFLRQMESDQVSGRQEREFAEVFAKADKVYEDSRSKHYLFCLDCQGGPIRKLDDLEMHPVISVTVEKKTGRIMICGTSTCCS